MKFKRLLAFLLALIMFNFSAFAEENSLSEHSNNHNPFYNALFDNISELYIENHLYDFDKETLYKETLLKFIDENPAMFQKIITTMLSTMDRFSNFYLPDSDFLSLDSLGYGINLIDVSVEDAKLQGIPNGIYIKSVTEGSNAAIAGIKPNDRIISVAGVNIEGIAFSGASQFIRYSTLILAQQDKKNGMIKNDSSVTPCEFVISRKNDKTGEYETKSIYMSVGTVKNNELSHLYYEEDSIAYIKISSFIGETLVEDFKTLITEIYNKGIKKITLDLRDNGGGVVDFAMQIVNLLVPQKDEILYYTESKNFDAPVPTYSAGGGFEFEGINVLINSHTASAAELTAMILRDSVGAKLIGENSYGKFLGQNTFSFQSGETLTVTSFEIISKNNLKYDKIGLVPDIYCPIIYKKFEFPTLPFLNHENYHEIVLGQTNDPILALEKRLQILGLLRDEFVDGSCDANTINGIIVFKGLTNLDLNGILDSQTIAEMTLQINKYKWMYTDYDSQFDVSLLAHKNYSQGKRLANEFTIEREKFDEIKRLEKEALDLQYEKEMAEEQESMKNSQ